jgi:hypothetical protein
MQRGQRVVLAIRIKLPDPSVNIDHRASLGRMVLKITKYLVPSIDPERRLSMRNFLAATRMAILNSYMSKQLLSPTLAALVLHFVFIESSGASETPKQPSSLQDFSMLGIKAGDDFESVLGNSAVMSGQQRDYHFDKKVTPFVLPPDLLEIARNYQGHFHGIYSGFRHSIPNRINLAYLDKSAAPKLLGAPVSGFRIEGRVDPADNHLKVVALECFIIGVDGKSFVAAIQEQFGFQGNHMNDGNGNLLEAYESQIRVVDAGMSYSPGVIINFRADNLAKGLDKDLEAYIKEHNAEKERKSRAALPQASGTLQ